MNFSTILSIVAIGLTFLGLIWQYFGWILKLKEQINNNANSILEKFTTFEKDVLQRLVSVETSQKFFQKYIDDIIPSVLHHPNTIEKDKLLENFKNLDNIGLTKLKLILLEELPVLTARKDPMVMNYVMLLARIDQKIGGNT